MTYHEFLSRDYVLFPTLVWKNCHDELEKMTLEEYDAMKKKWDADFEAKKADYAAEAAKRAQEQKKAKNRAELGNILETFILCAIGIVLAIIGESAGSGFWWFLTIIDIALIVVVLCA